MSTRKKNKFKKGSYIYIEGDEDINTVYIIEEGSVGFESSNQYVNRYKKSAKSGDIIGFVSSLSNQPRIESACALTDTQVAELSKSDFLTILQKNSDIAIKIINYFADELRRYDNLIFDTGTSHDTQSNDMRIYKLGEYYFRENSYQHAFYILNRFLQLYPESGLKGQARTIIDKIESTGLRSISEPIRRGISHEYVNDQIIFCEYEPGDELFIIKEGKVKIVKYKNDNEIMLSVLKEGDIFGELAIVSEKPRNATAISFGQTKLLPLTKDSLIELLNHSPDMLNKIFSSISKRVWFTYIRLEARIHKKPITRIYAFLEDKLLEEGVSLREKTPHVFKFGINELLDMTDLTQEMVGNSMEEILRDTNLHFNFGQITVNDPSEISSKARYFRTRDNLFTGESGES
jgi:CRP/FNR family transcriptional regulator